MSKRDHIAAIFRRTGMTVLLEYVRRKPCLIVLTYHRIGSPIDSPYDPGVFSATPEAFDDQVSYLKRHFVVMSLEETKAIAQSCTVLKHGGVLLTFDDGYADNYRHAFPILRSHGVEGTFFLCTSLVGGKNIPWWDRIAYVLKHTRNTRLTLSYPYSMELELNRRTMTHVIRRVLSAYKSSAMLDSARFMTALEDTCETSAPTMDPQLFMSWDQAREISRSGMAVGSHAHTHSLLAKLGNVEQRCEAYGSKQILENELKRSIVTFAYPCGSLSSRTPALLDECGYEAAFACSGGVNLRGDVDRFRIKRMYVENDACMDQFKMNTLIAATIGKDLNHGGFSKGRIWSAGPPTVYVQRLNWTEWGSVEGIWNTLVDASPYASFFHCPTWIRTWLDVFGPALQPMILIFRSENDVVAACLLVHRIQRRGPISLRRIFLNTSGEDEVEETSLEFNDLLCRAGYEASAAESLRRYLDTQTWDEFIVPGCSRTPASDALTNAFSDFDVTKESQPSFYVDLNEIRGTGASFDMSLSAKNRYHIRQSIRAYESDKPITVEHAGDRTRAQELFVTLAELHQRHWTALGRPGAFHSPRFVRFHQLLIDRAFDDNRVQITAVRHGQDVVGCVYNLGWRGKFYFYQCGFRFSDNKRLRPGLVTIRLAIEEMLNRGWSEFDLMAGNVEYKRSFSKRSRDLDWITFSRPTVRNATLRFLVNAREWTMKKAGSRLRARLVQLRSASA